MSEFENLLIQYQSRASQHLEEILPADNSVLSLAMRYSVLNGGKRLRPILVYLVGEIGEASEESLNTLAAAIELIHCYSLIHDDLPSMDNDDLRRGKPTTHKKFDEATAILAGDALQPLAFELLSEINDMDQRKLSIIKSIASACGHLGMVGGQIKDIHSDNVRDITSLDAMHFQKTGRLIQTSIETAGILSGLESKEVELLKEYGSRIGLAFQIQDDIIDIESPSSISGKDQGSDEKQDKITYPSLAGLKESKLRAQELAKEGKEILQLISKNTDNLSNLANYIVSRKT
jgi:geranylgeranyl pyrophosphate synthase